MVCFSGLLMSSASDQNLFCEVCSAFNCSFIELVGEKVVSPSYSSTILATLLLQGFNQEATNMVLKSYGFRCETEYSTPKES